MMTEQEKTEFAQKRVEAMTGFYIHLAIYVLVIAGLLAIDLLGGPGYWVQWPALGWGVGVLGHALAVFGGTPGFIGRWQARKIKSIRDGL